ncbi:MAG: hemerythrin domain-containing protein [Rhodospirillaceae bacterium]
MALAWSDDLKVDNEVMDADHEALFGLLARFEGAEGESWVAVFDELAHHLTEHFERENELMRRHDFFAYHCHHGEHESVLADVRKALATAKAGDLAPARSYLDDVIGPWFLNHRNTMDWVTAQYLKGISPGG